jgi:hypothetical protein
MYQAQGKAALLETLLRIPEEVEKIANYKELDTGQVYYGEDEVNGNL